MSKALALKYRPTKFSDLTEQGAVVKILTHQIETGTIKHGYLFCGGAGTGKTTSARIFANMINRGQGTPIELDAASNNSVDDIRRLTEEAQTQALDSEYKVFVIDECHSLSNQAWQAFLKTLEEPPTKSIFILCTTNPEKIPQTILSRVQRYNFQRISQAGIVKRLIKILQYEGLTSESNKHQVGAIEYIAKIADGGMRDAITLMDKCLSYSADLTIENVLKALGMSDYDTMFELNSAIFNKDSEKILDIITDVHNSGIDLKLFCKSYFEFILDLALYNVSNSLEKCKIPTSYENTLKSYSDDNWKDVFELMPITLSLQSEIKWEQNPKPIIIARLLIYTGV